MADTLASAYNPAAGRRCDPIPEPDFPWVPVTILPDMSSFETANVPLLGPLNQFSQTALDSRTEKNGFMKWNGASRSATGWNGLWRESDLWQPQGDCFVHLYKNGESKGGPAFRLSFQILDSARCHPLFDKFLSWSPPEFPMYDTRIRPKVIPERCLYIPAPAKNEQIQSFLHHLAIRNFFAWVLDRSLVGLPNLGGALVSLLYSMNEFRSTDADNVSDLKEYMDREGYLAMKDSPDHALAVLFFSEHFRLKDLWLDAFAHCVGMHDRLGSCPEFQYISRVSRKLINRARTEMSLRLGSCGESLSNFLSSEDMFFGFSAAAKAHLKRFRSFLQTYHAVKLGDWPPQGIVGTTAFPENVVVQMSEEFQKLYEYLAGENQGVDESPMTALGGICVLQNLQTFDGRHHYEPLAHRLPRLPIFTTDRPQRQAGRRLSKQPNGQRVSLKSLGSGSKSDKMRPDDRLLTASALIKASNSLKLDCQLVRAYRIFEQDCALAGSKSDENSLSVTEGRKVRWILIYAIHQTLLSATKIPEEVQDRKDAPYSLSVLTAGCPPWTEEEEEKIAPDADPEKEILSVKEDVESPPTLPPYSSDCLQPDIDYSHNRSMSAESFTTKTSGWPSRNSSLARRMTSRRRMSLSNISITPLGKKALQTPKIQQQPSFSEIIIDGYGNGSHDFEALDFSSPSVIEIGDGGSITASVREIKADEDRTPDRSSLYSSNSSSSRYSVPSPVDMLKWRTTIDFDGLEDSDEDEDEDEEDDEFGKGPENVRQAHKAIPFFDELRMSRECLDECYETVRKEGEAEVEMFV